MWHYFISDLFSLCLCALLPDFPLYARASTLSPFKKARKNVKALPWWLTVSAFHFRVIMTRYAHSCTSAAAISVGLITQSMMLFTERIIPECPRLSAGNSLQRDEYRLSWENRLCSIFRACSVLSDHISVLQTHQLQLFSTARDQIKKFKGHVTWLQIALEGWSYCNKVGRCVSSLCSTSNKNVLQGKL